MAALITVLLLTMVFGVWFAIDRLKQKHAH